MHQLSESQLLLIGGKTLLGVGAVVLQHELNHILSGDTYIDCCLSAFSEAELNAFIEILTRVDDDEMAAKSDETFYPIVTQPEGGIAVPRLLPDVLEVVVREAMTSETKAGFINRAQYELEKRR